VKHGGAEKDSLVDLRMCHRSREVHESRLADRGGEAMRRILSTLPRRGPHKCLLQWVHGLEGLQCLPYMLLLFDQVALVIAWGKWVIREGSWVREGNDVRWIVPHP
jgi:hypothetical protein